eukprot:376854-Pyramimonas_sp.AAC.1
MDSISDGCPTGAPDEQPIRVAVMIRPLVAQEKVGTLFGLLRVCLFAPYRLLIGTDARISPRPAPTTDVDFREHVLFLLPSDRSPDDILFAMVSDGCRECLGVTPGEPQ